MAKYHITYRNSLVTVEAPTKAAAVKQYRETVCPSPDVRLRDLVKYLTIERVKEPKKSASLKCAICESQVERKEFVSHVREH